MNAFVGRDDDAVVFGEPLYLFLDVAGMMGAAVVAPYQQQMCSIR